MRILVYDDSEINLKIAEAQFSSLHDLKTVSTYDEAQQTLLQEPLFDVALIDLLVPCSGQALADKSQGGKELPVGIFIGLLAAKKGARFVAVFTDLNHHKHPASACFDAFNNRETSPTAFSVESAKLILCNNTNWVRDFDPENLSQPLDWLDKNPNKVCGKNWNALLEYLLSM